MFEQYTVTSIGLNVRQEPSPFADLVGDPLKQGAIVAFREASDDLAWFAITTSTGQEGWVFSKYLKPVLGQTQSPWMTYARNELGQSRVAGEGVGLGLNNPRILEYLKSTSIGAPHNQRDHTDWCAAFANWCVEQTGYAGTNSARARDWERWAKEAVNHTEGTIVVFKRKVEGSFEGGFGHVGFLLSEDDNSVTIIGGNQFRPGETDAVTITTFPKDSATLKVSGFREARE